MFDNQKNDQIDYQAVAARYLKYWYLFILSIAICVGAAYVHLRYTTPKYHIETTLLVRDEKSTPALSESAAFSDLDLLNTSKTIDDEKIIIKSNSLMRLALTELELNTSYFVKGRVRELEIYGEGLPIKVIVKKLQPSAFEKRVTIKPQGNNAFELQESEEVKGPIYNFGQEITRPYGTFTVISNASQNDQIDTSPITVQFHDLDFLGAMYAQNLAINAVNPKSNVLSLSLTDAVPQKGIDIINKLVEVYDEEAVRDKNVTAKKTLDFIDERLKYLTAELNNVELSVQSYKQKNELADVSSQAQQYIAESGAYSKQMAELEIQSEVLQSIDSYLRRVDNQYQLVPSSLNIADPTLVGLISRFNGLQMERERLLRTVETSSPIVQNITEQLTNLRANILENIKNIKNSIGITRRNLSAKSGQFGSQIQRVPVIERQLVEITRQQQIKQTIYSYLLQKREESALSLAAAVSNTRIIDAAAASGPVSPNIPNTYIYSLLFGLALPFAALYIKNMLNNKVESISDIKQRTTAPILGQLIYSKTKGAVVVSEKSRTPIAEMFRSIRNNLQYFTFTKETKTLLVTSSMTGEGKTFFAINLASSLALTEKKVILVDFDLRKPNITQSLNINTELGITDYLVSNDITVDNIITAHNHIPNLFVIAAGQVPSNPGELIMIPKVEFLFSFLKENFDYIIIDTAPIGQVADTFALNNYTDFSIYLTRLNYTLKGQIDSFNSIYTANKLTKPMLVINGIKTGETYGYGAYGETEKKKSFYSSITGK